MKDIKVRPNEKDIYVWNIAGSIANALLSVVALMIVTRTLNDEQADIFSIAWSIGQLMATVGTFQIRMYQATDVTGVFKFYQYFIFRWITILVMLISSYIYIEIRGYFGKKAIVVWLICVFRAVDSLADVYEGWFQQKERLDLAGKALTYRVVIAVFGFALILYLTRDIVLSCFFLVIIYVICFLCYDIRYYYRVDDLCEKNVEKIKGFEWILHITKEGLPLFINAFLIMLVMNAPKMVLDMFIDQGRMEKGLQTIFNIIFMPASVLNLVYIVFRPLITKMAFMWNLGKPKELIKILFRIVICLCGIGGVLLLGSALVGIPILSFVYAIDLEEYKIELLIIIFGGCIYTFAAVLDNVLIVIRQQYILVLAYAITYVYIQFASQVIIGKEGIRGAAISYASAMIVLLIIMAIMFGVKFSRVYRENGRG